MKRIIAWLLIFGLVWEQSGFAQSLPQLPLPAYLCNSPAVADAFRPVHMRGVQISGDGREASVVLDSGDKSGERPETYTAQAEKLMEYFKIGIALPDDMFWVNLRPESPGDVIDPLLERTDVGRILLEADVQLKKDLALMTDPETADGRRYWNALYAKADEVFKGEDVSIPMNVRPWIVPGEIIIGETGTGAYIFKASLNVMLEQDRAGFRGAVRVPDNNPKIRQLNEYSAELIRGHILPKLIREVNISGRYAPLRQVYYSLILAQWAKKQRIAGKEKLFGAADNRDLTGLESKKAWSAGTYYAAYRDSFEKGEYNKQEISTDESGQVIRQYISGGIVFNPSDIKAVGIPEKTIKSVTSLDRMMNIQLPVRDGGSVDVKRALEGFIDGLADGRMHIIEPFPSDGLFLREKGPRYEADTFIERISEFLEKIPVEIKPELWGSPLGEILMEIAGNHYDAIASYYDPALNLVKPAQYQGEIILEFRIDTSKDRDFLHIVISDNGAGPDAANSRQKLAADNREYFLYLGGFGVGEANTRKFVEDKLGGTFSTDHTLSRAEISIPIKALELKAGRSVVRDGGEFSVFIGEYEPDECFPQKTLRMYDNLLQGKLPRPVAVSLLPEKQSVPVKELLITQPSVTALELAKRTDESEQGAQIPIVVWREGNKLFIADGHHRAVAAFLQGRDEIDAWIIDVPPAVQGKLEFTKTSDGTNALDRLNVLFQTPVGFEPVPLGRVTIKSAGENEVVFKVISEELYSYNLFRNNRRRDLRDGGIPKVSDIHSIPIVLERQYFISDSPMKSYGIRSCVCLIVRDEPNKRAALVHMTVDTDAAAALDTVLLQMGLSGRIEDARLTIAGGFYYRDSHLVSSTEAAALSRGIDKEHIRKNITDDSVRNIIYDPAADKLFELTDIDHRSARFSEDTALKLYSGAAKAAVSPGHAVAGPEGNPVYIPGNFPADGVSKDGGLATDDPQIWVPEISHDKSKQHLIVKKFLSFEEFMEEALHNPKWGYYGSGKVKIGEKEEGAHFATFPKQLSPVFGSLVAKRIVEVYNSMLASGKIGANEKFCVLEFGAGDGVLAFDILSYLSTVPEGRHITYMIGERSGDLRRRQAERLRMFIDQGRVEIVAADARDVSAFSRAPFKGIIISNELPDAFGVHRVRFRNKFLKDGSFDVALSVPRLNEDLLKRLPLSIERRSSLLEHSAAYQRDFGLPAHKGVVYLSKQDFTELLSEAAVSFEREDYDLLVRSFDFGEIFVDGSLFPEVGVYVRRHEQYISEGLRRNNGFLIVPVNTAASRYIKSAAQILNAPGNAGYILTIDYGANAYSLLTDGIAKSRLIRCYDKEHSRNNNPYFLPGERDITSDINFTDLAMAGEEAGLVSVYYGSQSNLWSPDVDKDIKLSSTGRYDNVATKFLKGKRFNMLLQKSANIGEAPQFSFQEFYGNRWGNPLGAALFAPDMLFIDSAAFEAQGPVFRIELANEFDSDQNLYFYLRTLAETSVDLTQTMYSTYTDNIEKAVDIIEYLDKRRLIRRGFTPGSGDVSRDGGKSRGPAELDELLDPKWLGPLLSALEELNGNKPLAVLNGFSGEVEIEDDFWITPVWSNGQEVLKKNSAIDDMSYVYAVTVDRRISYDPQGEIVDPGRDGEPDTRYTHVGYTYRIVVARKKALVAGALYDTSSQIDFIQDISEGNRDIAFLWEFSEQFRNWDESSGKFVQRRQIELETIALWSELQGKGFISEHVFPNFTRFASRNWAGLPIVANISNPVSLKLFNNFFVPGKILDGKDLSFDNPGYFEGRVPVIDGTKPAEEGRDVLNIGKPEAGTFDPRSVDPLLLVLAKRPLLELWTRFSLATVGSIDGLQMSAENIYLFKQFVRGEIEKTGRSEFVNNLAADIHSKPNHLRTQMKFFFGDPQGHDRQTAVMREIYSRMCGAESRPNVLYLKNIMEYSGANKMQVNQYLRALEAVEAVKLAEGPRGALLIRSADKNLLRAWFDDYLSGDEDFAGYFEETVPAIGDTGVAEEWRDVSNTGKSEAKTFKPWSEDPLSRVFAQRPLLALWARFSLATVGSIDGQQMSADSIREFKQFVRGEIEKAGRPKFVKRLAYDEKVRVNTKEVSALVRFFFGDPQDHDRQTAVMREIYSRMCGDESRPNVLYLRTIAEDSGVEERRIHQYIHALDAVGAVELARGHHGALLISSADKELLRAWFDDYLPVDEDFGGIARDGGKSRGPAELDELLDPEWLGPLLSALEKRNGNKPPAVLNGFSGGVEIGDGFGIAPVWSNGQAVLKKNSAIDDMSYVYAVTVDRRMSYDPQGKIVVPGRDGEPDTRYTHVGYTYRIVVARKKALVAGALYDTSSRIDFVKQESKGNGDIAFLCEFSEQFRNWDESSGKFIQSRQIELGTIALLSELQGKGLISEHIFSQFTRFASRNWAGLPIVANISNPADLKLFNEFFVPGKVLAGEGYFKGRIPAIGDTRVVAADRNVLNIGNPKAGTFDSQSEDSPLQSVPVRTMNALWARFSRANRSPGGLEMSVENVYLFKDFVRGEIEKKDFVKNLARDVNGSSGKVSEIVKFFFGDPQNHARQTAIMREIYYHMYGDESRPNVLDWRMIGEYIGVEDQRIKPYLRALGAMGAVKLDKTEHGALLISSVNEELLRAWFADYLGGDKDFGGIARDGGRHEKSPGGIDFRRLAASSKPVLRTGSAVSGAEAAVVSEAWPAIVASVDGSTVPVAQLKSYISKCGAAGDAASLIPVYVYLAAVLRGEEARGMRTSAQVNDLLSVL